MEGHVHVKEAIHQEFLLVFWTLEDGFWRDLVTKHFFLLERAGDINPSHQQCEHLAGTKASPLVPGAENEVDEVRCRGRGNLACLIIHLDSILDSRPSNCQCFLEGLRAMKNTAKTLENLPRPIRNIHKTTKNHWKTNWFWARRSGMSA